MNINPMVVLTVLLFALVVYMFCAEHNQTEDPDE